ncbi:MAG: hypothetical protein HZA53_00970 [Planctomycetes bacterium]|nr:hypothetical protein [Planctomycetota bacterium]
MSFRPPLLVVVITLTASTAVSFQAPPKAEIHVVRNVRLSDAADAPKSTLILRSGRIEAVLEADAPTPLGARIVDANGALALPAFLDAYSFAGFEMPKPDAAKDMAPRTNSDVLVDMRDANRKGILAAFHAADALKPDAEADKRYRSAGFGAWLAAPHGELLSGSSTLITTREAAARDRVRAPVVFAHGGFECTGTGYPGTLMGSIAQLRQFFLDARWVAELAAREKANEPGRRAPYDPDLAAAKALLERQSVLVCEAESAADIERWVSLADEFGLAIAISGGREAWRRAELLAQRKVPVILTLQWGEEVEDPHAADKKEGAKPGAKAEEPKAADAAKTGAAETPAAVDEPKTVSPQGDKPASEAKPAATEAAKKDAAADEEKKRWLYDEPMRVKEEKRRVWVEKRDCALRLSEKGVPFVFGSGKDAPKDLLDRARTLVEKGLPRDVAERALTTGVAELCGVGRHLGRIEAGFDASFALWSKHPLTDKEAHLAWLFVEGVPYEFELDSNELKGKPDEGVDATGSWSLVFESPDVKPASAELTMARDGKLEGVLRFKSPFDDSDLHGDVTGRVAGKMLRLTGRVKVANFEAEVALDGELEGSTWKGSTSWKWSGGENTSKFEATRKPQTLHEEGDGLDHVEDHAAHDPHGGGR